MKHVIVVGSGAGGATIARALQGVFKVTVLEAGAEFRPFTADLRTLARLKKLGLFFSEKQISLVFPVNRIRRTKEGMVLVHGRGTGGTTTICTGNAVRMDAHLRECGLDLDPEFAEIHREIPVTTRHRTAWRKMTRRLFDICQAMGMSPQPTPKMGNYERCVRCGRCVLGCTSGAKWDSRMFLDDAVHRGAALVTRNTAQEVVIRNGRALGVMATTGLKKKYYPADIVVLAAGGFGTPLILQNSSIKCEGNMFVDPVLCIAAHHPGSMQDQELPMPFVAQAEHYIISPYFDHLSFFFNKHWHFPAADIVSLMVKLADENNGSISRNGVRKALTPLDRKRLDDGVKMCTAILEQLGVNKDRIFLGTVNAGHPGGMLPLVQATATTLHDPRLPNNLYVADATLLPWSLGNPPILTIIALAKRIGKIIQEKFA